MKINCPDVPPISCFHSGGNSKDPFTREMLARPICASRPGSSAQEIGTVSYGQYLDFIKNFLVSRWNNILDILDNRTGGKIDRIDSVEIVAEKSGSDYHPASVRFVTQGQRIPFVANVAITRRGRLRLRDDFELLKYFYENGKGRFLPEPYLMSNDREFTEAESKDSMVMFLGQWLEGYHEFHLTNMHNKVDLTVVIWDLENGLRLMSMDQASEIYRQAAFILTDYFDLDDYREIFPWHHAAGDFVVNLTPTLDVKLVTVRQYAPRIQSDKDFTLDPYEAALLFLCNLTIRNRLDRLDGIRDMVWGPHELLAATLTGFFESLESRENNGLIKSGFTGRLRSICKKLDVIAWTQLFEGNLESFNPDAPDYELIESRLPEHIFEVYRLFQN